MDSPRKPRPKSAAVITSAYVENKREEAGLGAKLDCMYSQHCADMIRWRQAKDLIVQRRRNLLIQKGLSPLSTLERVMDEIQSHKRDKHTSNSTNTHLPASTAQRGDVRTYANWPPLSSLLHDAPPFTNVAGVAFFVTKTDRARTAVDIPKTKPSASSSQSPETPKSKEKKKQRTTSTEPWKPSSSGVESMTYKELGVIARLDNISAREEEKQKQQKLLERQRLKKTQETALQHKIDTFLKKFE